MLDFGREICGELRSAEGREWLVTNGIGGFAMGTIAGSLTRRYHGLLVAALKPPLGRTLLLANLDELAVLREEEYKLYTSRWASGDVDPEGYRFLEGFRLEGTTPVWTYALAEAQLEKRVWMALGENTTYIRYTLRRAQSPLKLYVKALTNHRDYHATTVSADWETVVEPVGSGVRLVAFPEATPLYLLVENGQIWPEPEWYWYEDYLLSLEEYRGQPDVQEDHLYIGTFELNLSPGESATIIASTESNPVLDGEMALRARREYEQGLLMKAKNLADPQVRHLVLAADQFLVQRPTPQDPDGRSIIAGYPWFSDWGRDTMVSLPGLTLTTGREDEAAQIMRTYARYVDKGMLPNRFPDAGETPEYNSVDATLWYFEAIRAYHQATGDLQLVRELFPTLIDIISWFQKGTRYGIRVDLSDSLLQAGEAGLQLTWMDAKVDDWVVTPRQGKPVEINALWYNALRITVDFARALQEPDGPYSEMARLCAAHFERFWYEPGEYCYDVIDGPEGDDSSLRPNQLLAASLHYSPLTEQQQRSVVDACARHLLTSHGLRTLSPTDSKYIGVYGGSPSKRDGAYHQGTVWAWLIGPFISAYMRVHGADSAATSMLRPLLNQLRDGCVGSVSELFDGDPPFALRGCPAQAWSVAELLRVWADIEQRKNQE
jgi:predicted glycogen debranching enzyme